MAEAREWRRRLELKARNRRPLFDTNERSRLLNKARLKRTKSRADFAELPKNVSRLPHEIKLKILTSMSRPNLTLLAAVNGASASLLYYCSSCSTWSELGVKIHSSWVFSAARGGPGMLPVLKSMMRFRIRSAADPYVWKMVGSRSTEVSCSWPKVLFDACLNDEALAVSSLFPSVVVGPGDAAGKDGASPGSGSHVWTKSFEAIHCDRGEEEIPAVFGKRAWTLKLSKKDRSFNVKRKMEGANTVVTDVVENIIVEMEHRSCLRKTRRVKTRISGLRRKELIEGMMSGKLRLVDSIVSNALISAATSAQQFEAVMYLRRRSPHVITSAIQRANDPLLTARQLFEQHFEYYNSTVGIYRDLLTGVVHPIHDGEPCMYFKGRQLCNFQAEQARLLFEIAAEENDAATAWMLPGLQTAATSGELELVQAMAPRLTLGQHQHAYLLAIRRGRGEVARSLRRRAGTSLWQSTATPLTHTFRYFATGFGAIKEGDPRAESTMKVLAELLERDVDKVEALRSASVRGKTEVVKYILANVEFVDRKWAVKDDSDEEMEEDEEGGDDEDGEWEDEDVEGGGGGSDTSDNYWN
ncbi:hypothetical protein BJ742DRAFT_739660 [Cladochytrium replicatum]|nr:hypothetical protein BJ742DRAFT_739660 [Cladochytrium replicatum]